MIVCIKNNKSSLLQIDALREIARAKVLTRNEGNSAFLCADMPFLDCTRSYFEQFFSYLMLK